ncbi:hypothetical protein MLD38_010854 [Melastoma candidum]|uniref:Uncharacterized protein n=1 Tax=Melastoma candidum TaxID=119954 RepID=A0ACB9R498_9MYRT|nr:hypothetical protein MLD38_010854 [Melastoma candidum]
MAVRSTRLLFLLVVLSLSALFLTSALAKEDPELKQCKHQCKHQAQFTPHDRQQCERRCEEYAREKHAREIPERHRRTGHGEVDEEEWDIDNYNRKRLEECREQCERKGEQQKGEGWQTEKERCWERCETRFGRRNIRRGEEEEEYYPGWGEEEEEEEFRREGGGRPYVFHRHDFKTKIETESGRAGLLPRFGKQSKLLRGIDGFRLGFLEVDPQAFVVPQHSDSDGVLFVVKGRGMLTVLKKDTKDNIDIEEGDIVRVRAGSPVYLVNKDSNERLQIAKLFRPINTPGHLEMFHGSSGQDRESFYTAFSLDVLQAALKTDRQSLEELFGQQQQGSIVQASREQVEALSGGKQEEVTWPFGKGESSKGSKMKSSKALNIFDQKPIKSNQYGQLRVVNSGDLKGLKDLDVAVTFVNITRGAMFGPYFNSRATKICYVPENEGYFEMACPHLSSTKSQRHHHHGRYGRGEGEYGRGEQYGWGERYGRGEGEFGRGEQYGRGERYDWGESEFGGGERYGRGESEFGRGDSRYGRGDSRRAYRRRSEHGRMQTYQTVRSSLTRGTTFIIPAGHPVVSMASKNNNLQIVCFEINAENNVRFPLAGKNNIISLMDKEAKELAFDSPSKEVDKVFGKQDEEFFFPGPGHQQQEEHRGRRGRHNEVATA